MCSERTEPKGEREEMNSGSASETHSALLVLNAEVTRWRFLYARTWEVQGNKTLVGVDRTGETFDVHLQALKWTLHLDLRLKLTKAPGTQPYNQV